MAFRFSSRRLQPTPAPRTAGRQSAIMWAFRLFGPHFDFWSQPVTMLPTERLASSISGGRPMNSIVEARIANYLIIEHNVRHKDVGAVINRIRYLAKMSGFSLDDRFARAGLGAGPEARIAADIVAQSIGAGGGCETPEYAVRTHVQDWIQRAG